MAQVGASLVAYMGREPFKHSLGVPVPCLTSEPAVPVFPPRNCDHAKSLEKNQP